MNADKPYEEIISRYSLGELNSVKKRIDANAFPERYELVLMEINKRKNGVGPEEVIREELKSALQTKPFEKSRRIKEYPAFILTVIFSGSVASTIYYKTEVEQLLGPEGSFLTFLLLIFGIYFGRKAYGE